MSEKKETLEGYVVDIICLRKYSQYARLPRARTHTVACGLKGHCIESGSGLVGDQGSVMLLDPAATPLVVATLQRLGSGKGVRLRVKREMTGEDMETVQVEVI